MTLGTPCCLCPNYIEGLHWHLTWDGRALCTSCARTPAGRKLIEPPKGKAA